MEKVVLAEERNKGLFSAPQKLTQRGELSTALEPKIKTRVVLRGRTRY